MKPLPSAPRWNEPGSWFCRWSISEVSNTVRPEPVHADHADAAFGGSDLVCRYCLYQPTTQIPPGAHAIALVDQVATLLPGIGPPFVKGLRGPCAYDFVYLARVR